MNKILSIIKWHANDFPLYKPNNINNDCKSMARTDNFEQKLF